MAELANSYSLFSDTILAQYAGNGDNKAFDELVMRYLGTISFIARRFSAQGYEQKDFVQEGLLGLLYSCRTFDENGTASFKSYMSVVVERRFISIIRKSNADRNIPQSNIVMMDDVCESIEDTAHNPEEFVLCSEHLKSVLNRLKATLSKNEYDVLMLFGSGLSYREIAQRLSVTEKAVDNALQRARRKISHGNMS